MARNRFGEFLKRQNSPRPIGRDSLNITGNYIYDCEDIRNSYECRSSSQLLHCNGLVDSFSCIDGSYFGYGLSESAAFVSVGFNAQRISNCVECWGGVCDLSYCSYCSHSSHLFACIGLSGREYCILNRQYRKKDYFELKKRIVRELKKDGVYGLFFSPNFSGYAYDNSLAQHLMPLSKVKARLLGFSWSDGSSSFSPSRLGELSASGHSFSQVPDLLDDVHDALLNDTFLCEISARPYRIIGPELDLYRELRVPLPVASFEERHRRRVAAMDYT